MSPEQFDIEFDLLFNNISSNQAPGHTPYEKTLFLIEAQDDIVKDLYSGKSGPYEKTEETAQYLRVLTEQADFDVASSQTSNHYSLAQISNTEWEGQLPSDCWFIIYEHAILNDKSCSTGVPAMVLPVTHNEFYKAQDNPFRGPNKRKILRLLIGDNVQLFSQSDYQILNYSMRYLRKPAPFALPGIERGDAPDSFFTELGVDVEDSQSVEDITTNGKECELPESLHRAILLRAVQLAKASWQNVI